MKNKMFLHRCLLMGILMCAGGVVLAATEDPNAVLNTISGKVSGLLDGAWKIALAVAGVLGVIGAIVCYGKFQQGDPNATKSVYGWAGAVIIFIVMGAVLKAVFA